MDISKKWVFLALSIFSVTQTGLFQNFIGSNVGITAFGHDFSHNITNILTMIMGILSLKTLGKGIFR